MALGKMYQYQSAKDTLISPEEHSSTRSYGTSYILDFLCHEKLHVKFPRSFRTLNHPVENFFEGKIEKICLLRSGDLCVLDQLLVKALDAQGLINNVGCK